WAGKSREVAGAHSKAHSASHCWHRARCSSVSGLSASLRASSPPAPSTASCLSSSSSPFCSTLSFSSWMVSSSPWTTWWGTQLPSMAVRKGSGAQTSTSSLRVGMRR
ncbi:hypothetical protein N331_06124, partial [Merops nubicus]